jgi:hypothetical protein
MVLGAGLMPEIGYRFGYVTAWGINSHNQLAVLRAPTIGAPSTLGLLLVFPWDTGYTSVLYCIDTKYIHRLAQNRV